MTSWETGLRVWEIIGEMMVEWGRPEAKRTRLSRMDHQPEKPEAEATETGSPSEAKKARLSNARAHASTPGAKAPKKKDGDISRFDHRRKLISI
jgi:hypothetical protein